MCSRRLRVSYHDGRGTPATIREEAALHEGPLHRQRMSDLNVQEKLEEGRDRHQEISTTVQTTEPIQ